MRQILNQDKIASLLGLSSKGLVIKRDAEKYIKSHQTKDSDALAHLKEIDLARAIF